MPYAIQPSVQELNQANQPPLAIILESAMKGYNAYQQVQESKMQRQKAMFESFKTLRDAGYSTADAHRLTLAKVGVPLPTGKDAGQEKFTQEKIKAGIEKGQLNVSPTGDVSAQKPVDMGSLKDLPLGTTISDLPGPAGSRISIAGGKEDVQNERVSLKQDKLEQQAMDRVSRLRGDLSLSRVENQRDGSIQAYNTIERIKKENRRPSQLEYYDLLGQLWRARNGVAPTDQALKELDSRTLHGDVGRLYQYFAGKPAGRTTNEVLQNIQDFAKDSGKQADKFHAAYMKSHKIKPKDLEDDRWQAILDTNRGLSFDEGTSQDNSLPTNATQSSDLTGSFKVGKYTVRMK